MNKSGNNIPDSYGQNAFLEDQEFSRLLNIYLDQSLFEKIQEHFIRLGALVGGHLEDLALAADKNPPVLHVRTRTGQDLDRIEKHPSFVALERYAYGEFGLAAMSHRTGVFGVTDKLPPVVKYALSYLFVQAEFGLCCPLSMTDALTRTLSKFGSPDLIDRYLEGLTSQDMDQLLQGAMFITEQEAGSDVGAVKTHACFEDGQWRLYGEKWFCSNPDADLAMVMARPEGGEAGTKGLSLYLLPRYLPDGTRNNYRIVRLKEKLGTRSMASGEIVLEGATAYLVGEPRSGFKQMADMINTSRLSNGMRSAGLMRRAFGEALFVARNRSAFNARLITLPLTQVQLVKMLVATEQARTMFLHTANLLQKADAGDSKAILLMRILTPLIKFRTCRDARKVAGDGMEVRGGCGFIEEWSDARVLRDAHLGSIWEGTSNVVALDVIRAIRRTDSLAVLQGYLSDLLDEVGLPSNSLAAFQKILDRTCESAASVSEDRQRECDVRQIASGLYNITSAVLMAWEASRMNDRWNRLALAHMVLKHKLLPRDPLVGAGGNFSVSTALLEDQPLSMDLACSVLDEVSGGAS